MVSRRRRESFAAHPELVDGRGSIAIKVAIAALALVCSVAGVAVFVLKLGPMKPGAAKAATSLVPVGEMVVNLADAREIHYLKTDIVLEVKGALGENEEGEVKTRVRDAIISTLGSKRFAELIRPDGKVALKKQILEAVNKRLGHVKAVDVLFNDFAMQ
jgi:flagellar basal body-associated protein FliL